MESIPFEAGWQSFHRSLETNLRINREMLRVLLRTRTEKRLRLLRIKAILMLLSPLVLLIPVTVLDFHIRTTPAFLLSLVVFLGFSALTYLWNLQHLRLLRQVDFSNPLLQTRRDVARLEKHKLRRLRISYLLAVPAAASVLVMTFESLPPMNLQWGLFLGLAVLIFAVQLRYTYRHGTVLQLRKINEEIAEMEDLMQEPEPDGPLTDRG